MYKEKIMQVTSISNFRKDIKKYVDDVDKNHEPLIVTRSDNVSVVVISLADYNSMDTTDYLLSTPTNKSRIIKSYKNVTEGKLEPHELIET